MAADLLNDIDSKIDIVLLGNYDVFNVNNVELVALVKKIEEFQQSPQLLDNKLRRFIEKLLNSYISNVLEEDDQKKILYFGSTIGLIFYTFTKVRGFKTISNCLSSTTALLASVSQRCSLLLGHDTSVTWQETYLLLVWLSILILVPFPLVSISSSLPETLFNLANHHLQFSGSENDAATILMGRFLSRYDNVIFLNGFLQQLNSKTNEQWTKEKDVIKIGIFKTTNFLLKIGKLQLLFPFLKILLNIAILNLKTSKSTMVIGMCIKNLGKLGVIFLEIGDYDSVEDIIEILIHFVGANDTSIRYYVSKQLSKIGKRLPLDMKEDIFLCLIKELNIPNIPNLHDEFTNFSSIILLDLQVDYEDINIETYHGVLTCLGEFSRMKLLSLPFVFFSISLIHKTLFLQQHKLTHSVGSQIRDSSCFVAWAISKRYRQDELPLTCWLQLFKDLMLSSCFDRDLMIRRASSAAMQELVGRNGDAIFKTLVHFPSEDKMKFLEEIAFCKLKLIELLDFTALGQISRSFDISFQISTTINNLLLNEFVDYLTYQCVHSLDYEIRVLSVKTLRRFLEFVDDKLYTERILDRFLTNIETYKFSVISRKEIGLYYAVAELLPLLDLHDNYLNSIDFHELFKNIKFDYHRDHFHKGEEYIYLIYRLIELTDFAINDYEYDCLFDIIRQNNEHIEEKFILLASKLKDIPTMYSNKWIHYIKNKNIIAAKSIGYSPVISVELKNIMHIISNPNNLDAGIKTSLLDSISTYLKRRFDDEHKESSIDKAILLDLLQNLDDYTITNQGDVGHFIREASISLIYQNLELFTTDETLKFEVEKRLVRLSCEIMDKVRLKALKLLLIINKWESYYITYQNKQNLQLSSVKDASSLIESQNLSDAFHEENSLLTFNSISDYFSLILEIYRKEYLYQIKDAEGQKDFNTNEEKKLVEISKEFWRGYSFSAGALHSSDANINSSVHSFCQFYERDIDVDDALPVLQNIVLMHILSILKADKTKVKKAGVRDFKIDRFVKSQNCCLNFWLTVLDLNLTIPHLFNLQNLFIRTYNLHINSTNVARLETAVNLFVSIYLRDPSKFPDCKKRLIWISENHPISQVKKCAIQGLKEIDYEESEIGKQFT
ncbi:hypothetical protein B5S33_g3618 [[Candida] boidinii]|nr:hypothetical protein B5S30_g1591 [[Candida] boidinii]OWB84961.1 hypothetical protein B5S33_g3618 [[Candida] boidinii]